MQAFFSVDSTANGRAFVKSLRCSVTGIVSAIYSRYMQTTSHRHVLLCDTSCHVLELSKQWCLCGVLVVSLWDMCKYNHRFVKFQLSSFVPHS